MNLYSVEAEKSVIGGVMRRPQMLYAVESIISPDDFYNAENRTIWRALLTEAKAGRGIDSICIHSVLRHHNRPEFELSEIVSIESDLGSAVPDKVAERVRELAQRRRVVAFAEQLTASADSETAEEMIAKASASLDSLLRSGAAKSQRFTDCAQEAIGEIINRRRSRESGQAIGMISGVPSFDALTSGIHGPRLVVLAARPKSGKTAFLNQAAIATVKSGAPGLIVSLEMGAYELMSRALAMESGTNLSALTYGERTALDDAAEAIAMMGDLPLWIDTQTYNLDAICAQIALHKHRHGIQWAAVDHIGLVKTTGKFGSRNDQIGHISWTLKQLAKRLNIPIIALSQLNRDCDRDNRRPRADDLRDSGNVEQDADMVVMIHVPLANRQDAVKKARIGITANRAGPTGWIQNLIEFTGANQRFKETNEKATDDND